MDGKLSATEVRFDLMVQPEGPRQHWHATLRCEDAIVLELDSPLELARHLANLGFELTESRPRWSRHGLR